MTICFDFSKGLCHLYNFITGLDHDFILDLAKIFDKERKYPSLEPPPPHRTRHLARPSGFETLLLLLPTPLEVDELYRPLSCRLKHNELGRGLEEVIFNTGHS